MDRRHSRLSRRLGGPDVRRRRHRIFALIAAALLVVAAVFIFILDEEAGDGGFRSKADATCTEFGERVQSEFALSFPDGAPPTAEAAAEYLSHAFADTMDELVDALRALEPQADAAEAIDALAGRIDEIRATPADFVDPETDPFADVAAAFDDVGVPACGSDFFPDAA